MPIGALTISTGPVPQSPTCMRTSTTRRNTSIVTMTVRGANFMPGTITQLLSRKAKNRRSKGFWSITLYNEHHLFAANALNRYSLGTKSKSFLKYNPNGSLTLYFGVKSPGKDKETNWVPAPAGTFSLYIRAYWAEQAILDGTWMPPNVERVQ